MLKRCTRAEWLNTTSANNNNSNERAVARDTSVRSLYKGDPDAVEDTFFFEGAAASLALGGVRLTKFAVGALKDKVGDLFNEIVFDKPVEHASPPNDNSLSYEGIKDRIETMLGEGKISGSGGTRYTGSDYQIRLEKGNPNLPYSSQHQPYCKIIEKGEMLDKYGNRLIYNQDTKSTSIIDPNTNNKVGEFAGKPKEYPNSHINPYDPDNIINVLEWIDKWKGMIKR